LFASPPRSSLVTLTRAPPGSTLFPYTTLFRSQRQHRAATMPQPISDQATDAAIPRVGGSYSTLRFTGAISMPTYFHRITLSTARSEEHTSELQSRENLVCRLLLEKKKHGRVRR